MPDHSTLTGAPPKNVRGRTIAALKRAKQRLDAHVLQQVRAEVFERDQVCRIAQILGCGLECEGDHQLMHLPPKRRSQTRGRLAQERHDRKFCLRGCAFHHDQEERHQLRITFLTADGTDGPLLIQRGGATWTEDR